MDLQHRFQSTLATYPARKAVFFISAVVVALHLALSLFAWALAQHEIVPVLEQKAYATGLAEARKLTRRLANGTPIEKLEGIQQQFDSTLQRNPDLAYIILTDAEGRILVRSGSGAEVFTPERYSAVTREVERRLVTYGRVHVGIDRQFIVARMKGVRVDLAMILLASLLLSLGLAGYAAHQAFGQPVGQVAQVLARLAAGDYRFRPQRTILALQRAIDGLLDRVNGAYSELATVMAAQVPSARATAAFERLRATRQFAGVDGTPSTVSITCDRATPMLLAFLCLMTDALTRPSLAHHAAELAAFRAAVAAPLRAALPVAALYLAAALSLPLARNWAKRAGTRNAFTAGAVLLALGCAAAGLVDDYVTLVLARVPWGIGMAIAVNALLPGERLSSPGERRGGVTGFALLAGALLAAECAGPALGGIVARHGGIRDVFALAAVLGAIAAACGQVLLDDGIDQAPAERNKRRALSAAPGASRAAPVPPHWRPYLVLSLSAQLPAALALGAVPPILLPLALHRAGFDWAEAGRYGPLLAAVLIAAVPLMQRLAYRSSRYALFGVLGAALMGAGIGPLSDGSLAQRQAAISLALLAGGQLLVSGTCLVLAQRAARAAQFRLGALAPTPWLGPLACACAAAGAVAAGAAAHAYGPLAAAASSGSLSLMAGAGFMLAALLLRYNQPTLTSCPPR